MNKKRMVLSVGVLAMLMLPFAGVAAAASKQPTPPATASTVAVIGDIPYGTAKIAQFPSNIAQINADPDVSRVLHLGDIKNGSSVCSDEYFNLIKTDFDQFQDPFVYTPGDNEWTDCHRANNGGYVPTERLAQIRNVFFPNPGTTLGQHPARVATQAANPEFAPFVENTMWSQSNVVLGALNLPGSNNDLVPWFGITPISQTQRDEYNTRLNADLEWLNKAFNAARQTSSKGVVLMLQADMWDPAALNGDGLDGFDPIVQRIATLASRFNGQVLLLEGDSHAYRVDHPFVSGDPLYSMHPLAPRKLQASNVTRIVVDGSSNANDYLKLTIDPNSPNVFSWTKVPFTS